jgi:hypothetical protein
VPVTHRIFFIFVNLVRNVLPLFRAQFALDRARASLFCTRHRQLSKPNKETRHLLAASNAKQAVSITQSRQISNAPGEKKLRVFDLSHVMGVFDLSHVMGVFDLSHVMGVFDLSHVTESRTEKTARVFELSHVMGVFELSHVTESRIKKTARL